MSDEVLSIPSRFSGMQLEVGPKDSFKYVQHGTSEYWICSSFHNISPEALVATILSAGIDAKDTPTQFALLEKDVKGDITAMTDRYGGVPLYVWGKGKTSWVSTSLYWLVRRSGMPVQIDEQSIGELLTFKFVLGDKTIVKDVSRIAPATRAKLGRDGNWESTPYWSPVPPTRRTRLKDEAGTLVELFRNGMRAYTAGMDNVGVTLSGGLDSRAILGAALQNSQSVTALTTGIAGGMDHRYALAAAAAADVPTTLALLDSDYQKKFYDFTRQSLSTYEGMLLTPGTEAMWLIEKARNVPIQLVLHGALGELAKGSTANHFAVSPSDVSHCRKNVGEFLAIPYQGAHESMLAVLRPSIRESLRGEAIRSLRAEADSLAERMDSLDVPFAMQITEHFRNSGTYSGKIWSRNFPVIFPFSNPAYVDHLLAIDPNDRMGASFHRHLIGKLHKGLYECPESNSGCAVSAGPLARKISKFWIRVQGKLKVKRVAGHTDFCSWINNMRPGITDVLIDNSTLGDQMWDKDVLQKYIALSNQGDQRKAAHLYRLFCVEKIYQDLTTSIANSD